MTHTNFTRLFSLLLLTLLACILAIANEEGEKKDVWEGTLGKEEALEKRLAEEKEIKAQFEYSFNDVYDKLVTVTCDSSRGRSFGSGFVANMEGKTYLFTNQHVILGADKISFKTANGTVLKPRGVELSTTRDIARLLLAEGTDGFEIANDRSIGSPIAVFGNSEGGGVATELYGKITTVGSEQIDVSADFVFGNSGSPVLNLDQKVIAIASSVKSYGDDEHGSKTRHFCYRLADGMWKPVNWKKYNDTYGKQYRDTEQLIGSIFDAAVMWYNDPYTRMTAEDNVDAELSKWATEHNHVINRIMRLSDKGNCSPHELENTNKRIKKDMVDSSKALSAVCRKRSRQMRMLSEQRELTEFLRAEFKVFAARLESSAFQIDRYGNKLSTIDYFHFK